MPKKRFQREELTATGGGDGPIDVLVSSGGTFRIGLPGGLAVGVGTGFRSQTRCRFDRHRCWKRLDGERLESRLLLSGTPLIHLT
jgi:hypothetical protein